MSESYAKDLCAVGPKEQLNWAREIIKKFESFKDEIDGDVKEIVEKVQALKEKLTQQKYNKDSRTGCLTGQIDDYFECFCVDTEDLETLLQEDLENWK